jgi:hypothetical protein
MSNPGLLAIFSDLAGQFAGIIDFNFGKPSDQLLIEKFGIASQIVCVSVWPTSQD